MHFLSLHALTVILDILCSSLFAPTRLLRPLFLWLFLLLPVSTTAADVFAVAAIVRVKRRIRIDVRPVAQGLDLVLDFGKLVRAGFGSGVCEDVRGRQRRDLVGEGAGGGLMLILMLVDVVES